MVEIVDRLHKYVPTVTRTEMFEIPLTDELISIRADYFHHITFGGDQLTSARIRGAQIHRSNSEHPIEDTWKDLQQLLRTGMLKYAGGKCDTILASIVI